jgi:hypothetical protein
MGGGRLGLVVAKNCHALAGHESALVASFLDPPHTHTRARAREAAELRLRAHRRWDRQV